jgi:hypothetical protein
MPTLFIHVGPPKTGTSAIQHLLRSHDDSVVIYPKTALWADGSHHNLAFNFYADFRWPEVVRIDTEAVFDQIAAQAHGTGRNIVISSERLLSTDIGRFITALRSRLDKTLARKNRLRSGIGRNFSRTKLTLARAVAHVCLCADRPVRVPSIHQKRAEPS